LHGAVKDFMNFEVPVELMEGRLHVSWLAHFTAFMVNGFTNGLYDDDDDE